MKHNIFMILAGVGVLFAFSACDRSQQQSDEKSESESAHSIEGADVTKAVTNISKSGKTISFTIPSDGRAFDDAAQGTTSAIYDSAKGKPDDCPKVSSTEVSKEVGDYDAISGKAEITATFDDQEMADKVYTAGCLIIDDA